MTARESRPVNLALKYMGRSGCSPAEAADKYGVDKSTILRAMRRWGLAVRPRGRPKTVKPLP